jgi:hypothetical protein
LPDRRFGQNKAKAKSNKQIKRNFAKNQPQNETNRLTQPLANPGKHHNQIGWPGRANHEGNKGQ